MLALSACECPPSADAPKKIIPTEYSRICVLNSVHNTYSINIDTKYGNIFENLLFQDEIEKENFYKIAVHLNEKYLIESASLNTTNENITIHGYQINGPTFASLLEEIVIINLKT